MPFLDDIGAVTDRFSKMQVLLGQNNRYAVLFQIHDHARHALHNDGRDALGWLIEQNDERIAHERARDGEHLLLAAAHARGRPAADLAILAGTSRDPMAGALSLPSPIIAKVGIGNNDIPGPARTAIGTQSIAS